MHRCYLWAWGGQTDKRTNCNIAEQEIRLDSRPSGSQHDATRSC